MRRIFALGVAAGMWLALSGCGASTTVKTMWTASDFNPKETPFKNVYVMGVYRQQGTGLAFEQEMKKQFASKKIKAGGSLDDFSFDDTISKEALKSFLDSTGYDAVLLSKMTDQTQETSYTPGYTYTGGYYGWYSGAYGMYSSPGYVTTYEIVHIESNLFDVKTEKMVWAGTSEIFAPSDALDAIKSFCPAVVNTLVSKKYFVRP